MGGRVRPKGGNRPMTLLILAYLAWLICGVLGGMALYLLGAAMLAGVRW